MSEWGMFAPRGTRALTSRLSLRERSEGDGGSSFIGTSLAVLFVSASSMAMASGDPDGCEPSGDGFPKGAGITYKEKV